MFLRPVHIDSTIRREQNQRGEIIKPVGDLNFDGISHVVIYLGDTCNFDCTYCDRAFIKYDVGSQNLKNSDFSEVVEFLKVLSETPNNVKYVSFHGGEPLLYIKKIDRILDQAAPYINKIGAKWAMTTNGSLIPEHEWFFKKWGHNLSITLSYDFKYQEVNREPIDLDNISRIIHENNACILLQFVVPTNIADAYEIDTAASVINSCKKLRCHTVNIIPLRHLRGKRKFQVVLDDLDMKWFPIRFMRFIHTLYVQGLNIHIDGNYDKIDKQYLNNHSKLILGPDGYIYPEFDFLEYKNYDYRVGEWRNKIELYRVGEEDSKLLDQCRECPLKSSCGLKYLYKMFDETPQGNCVEFYKIIDLMVQHLAKLKTQPTLLHWIGYE